MSMDNAHHPTDSNARCAVYIAAMLDVKQKIDLLTRDLRFLLQNMSVDPVESVHGIRKHTKFIRALLGLGSDKDSGLAAPIKRISKILAPFRDAQVNLETYQSLILRDAGFKAPELFAVLNGAEYLGRVHPDRQQLDEMAQLTLQFQADWVQIGRQLDRESIHEKLVISYIKCYAQSQVISINSGTEVFHAWRKKVKKLWYRIRFIADDIEQTPEHVQTQLDGLGKSLGEIHDLDVLGEIAQGLGHQEWLATLKTFRQELADQAIQDARITLGHGSAHFINILHELER